MSYKLEKPYTEKERMDFIVEYNHTQGLRIEEGVNALYALEANEIMVDDEPVVNPDYEAEQAKKEAERIAHLYLTAADVERGIYKATGKDFDDIVTMLENSAPTPTIPAGEGEISIDVKALKIELKANNFYRGNPYVEAVGALLGFTPEQLDKFFDTNDWHELVNTSAEVE